MTTFRLEGTNIFYSHLGDNAVNGVGAATLEVALGFDSLTMDYRIIGDFESYDGSVWLTPFPEIMTINGEEVFDTNTDVYIATAVWGDGNETEFLYIETDSALRDSLFRLSGDPLPLLESPDDVLDFMGSVTRIIEPDSAETEVDLLSIPGITILPEDLPVERTGAEAAEQFLGGDNDDILRGAGGNDTLEGHDGADTLSGGDGDDLIFGGATAADRRDVIYGGAGNDSVDAGYGNDELHGGLGNDTMAGGYGADTVIGNQGDDFLTGSVYGDLIFGGDGFDFINGGYGSDLLNGGAGGDRFFHTGVAGHGSDWIQDFSAAEGDRLHYGGAGATRDQFQVNFASSNSGDANVDEAFVIYRPTGQILWALVDGAGQDSINLQIGSETFDLLV